MFSKKNGNHNDVILNAFQQWINLQQEESMTFRYLSRMFLHYGPLLDLFDFSTHYNFGLGREACYILQVPSFAQLGLRNYYTEKFIHVVNFTQKWPLAFRYILRNNCLINLSGHSTVKTCTQLSGSVDLVKMIRDAYKGKESFDVHHTTRHSGASPLEDQVKGAWFWITQRLFSKAVDDRPVVFKSDSEEKVPLFCLDVEQKGVQKIKDNFSKKLHDSFPDVRYTLLEKM